MKAVLVTTKHRGVFFGYADDTSGSSVTLEKARCAIRWSTRGGFLELAEKGPNANSKIGSRAPSLDVRDVTSVATCTDAAIAAWEAA